MKPTAVLAGVVAAVACWGAAAVAGPPSLFPLSDGATWRLTDERGSALVVRASRSGQAFVLRGLPGLAAIRVRANGRDVESWDAQAARWRPFLRLGAPTGTRYVVDVRDSALWRSVEITVASRSAACSDARARPVRGCVALELRSRKPIPDAGVERLVFAPGIGLAEVVVLTIAGPRTYSLSGATGSLE
jgi:hypothetical protein